MTAGPNAAPDGGATQDTVGASGGAMARGRALIAIFLVILTTVGAILAPVAWWVRQSVFDEDQFLSIVEPSLGSDEVAAAVGDLVAEQAIEALDLQMRLASGLGQVDEFLGSGLADTLDLGPAARRLLGRLDLPRLSNLAGPVAAAAEAEIRNATERFVSSPEFQTLLVAAVAEAHQSAVALLRGDTDSVASVRIVDGEVVWDLVPAITSTIGFLVNERLGGGVLDTLDIPSFVAGEGGAAAASRLADALGVELPDDFGQVALLSEEQLETWQYWTRLFDRGVWALIIGAVLALIAAVVVSPRRRRTLVYLAFGGVVGVVLVVLIQRQVTDSIQAAISDPLHSEAFRVVAGEMVSSLRRILIAVGAAGVVVGLTAHVLGRPAWQENVSLTARRLLSGGAGANRLEVVMARHRDAFAAAGIAAALIVWSIFGLSLLSFLLVGGVLGAYLLFVMVAGRQSDDVFDQANVEVES